MKFFLILSLIITFTDQAEINWLKPSDYRLCEWADGDPKSIEVCNNRWDPKNYDSQVYKNYACCLVKFKIGNEVQRGCYIVENSKTGRKKYSSRVLHQFEDVEILCGSKYLKIGFLIFLLFLLF